MSATTRVAPPTAAATGLGLRDRVRSRTRAMRRPGAENASARSAVGGEPSATALRASRDDHPGRFGDDSWGMSARSRARGVATATAAGTTDTAPSAPLRPRSATGSWSDDDATASSSSSSGYYPTARTAALPRRDAADAARDAGASAHRRDRRAVRLLLGRARDRDAGLGASLFGVKPLSSRSFSPSPRRRFPLAPVAPPRAATPRAGGTSASGGAASRRGGAARARPRPASTTAASMRPSPGC